MFGNRYFGNRYFSARYFGKKVGSGSSYDKTFNAVQLAGYYETKVQRAGYYEPVVSRKGEM